MTQTFSTASLLHGGDYNPEQWLNQPEILEKDMEYFKKAKINTVTLGIFSWAVLEPEEDRYEFEWLKTIINRLYENGISTILATPSGARPKWLADKYPEVLRVDEKRRRALFGGRHNHCFTSPVYREKVKAVNTELARRFGSHPGVILWHISNEYSGECHCPLCQKQFRLWLKKKYQTISHLNDCWCTTFWSHKYTSFDQIESPSSLGEHELHALVLDWKRFVTDRTLDFMRFEIDTLCKAGSQKPVTTNFMYDFMGLNYYKFKQDLAVVSWDNYPAWHKKPEIETALDCGFQHDLMRSIQGRPFLLMESCPSATNWQPVSKLKKPGMLALSSLQAIAHGSDSVLYFQLRQSRGASEKFHGAVIDHYGGEDTRVFQEVSALGRTLSQLQELAGAALPKEAALLCDTESRWAMDAAQGPRNQKLPYKEVVQGFYNAVRSFGIHTDIIDMETSLDGYKLVIAPMQYLFRCGIWDKLEEFVKKGGVLIMTFWSGIVDEYDRCFLGSTPNGLDHVLGLRFAEIDGLYDHEKNHLIPAGQSVPDTAPHFTRSYSCHSLCELIRLSDAKPLMVYGDDFYAGWPAVTWKSYGLGEAYYVSTATEPDFYKDLITGIVPRLFPNRPVAFVPHGIEVTLRENAKGQYLFLQNFNRTETAIEIDWPFDVCLCGQLGEENGVKIIKPFDTVVLKKEKRPPTIDLFLFMGQSNMAGRGIVNELWPQPAPDLICGAGYEYRAVSSPFSLFPLTEPFGQKEDRENGIDDHNMKTGSMVAAFVNAYFEKTQTPIVGISASKGGSSILEWQPDTLYLEDAKKRLGEAKAFLSSHGYKIRHIFMAWCQGETDGDHQMSGKDYQTYFSHMWKEMKSEGAEHCFLVAIGQYNGSAAIDYQEIRAAQKELPDLHPDVTLVSESFVAMKERGLMKDEFHYFQQAYNEVGKEAGKRAAESAVC